jgi:endonuclease III
MTRTDKQIEKDQAEFNAAISAEMDKIHAGLVGKSDAEILRHAREYCSQNDWDCETCSLANYGRDCHNNPIQHEIY